MTETYSISLLTGLHEKTRDHFLRAGIHSLHQIAEMDIETLQQFSHIGPATAPALKAQAQAYLGNCPVWYGTLPDACQLHGWYFDIETNPSTDEVWSIGWCWHDSPVQNVIVVPDTPAQTITLPNNSEIFLVPTMRDAWQTFAEAVASNTAPIHHWTGFDASNMRRFAPRNVQGRLLYRLHDLHGSFKRAVQLPQRSTSLKVVAPLMGFTWQGYQDWWQAFQDYRRYLHTLDPSHLARACAYQADDVKAMVTVLTWLNDNRDSSR